jgi:predicted permease
MQHILNTILPVFAIILLGWLARRKQYIPPHFIEPANHLVYYLAIPAMIFRSISRADFSAQLNGRFLSVSLVAIVLAAMAAWITAAAAKIDWSQRGTFLQSSFHGNLGYIGLAVAYYYLGDDGLVSAGILAGFMMILQNFLSVFCLQLYAARESRSRGFRTGVMQLVGNPVIVGAVSGIIFSVLEVPIPMVVDKSLEILGDMALPMALLIIGASLSFEMVGRRFKTVMIAAVIKLVVLPAVGLWGYRVLNLDAGNFLPGLILLACPTATVAYIMAEEMGGDAQCAIATISASTLLSGISFLFWLKVAG